MAEITYRQADVFDASALLELLIDMHEESPVRHSAVHAEKAMNMIVHTICQGFTMIAETEDGELVGSIGGEVVTDWWSVEPLMGDRWFYVKPDHRKSGIAARMVKSFITEAKRLTGRSPKMGVVNGADIDRKRKFFERQGLVDAGSIFMEGK